MLIGAYSNYLTLAGYRPTTISSRRKVLTAYENSLQGTPLHSATRLHVEAFLARDLAPESRRAYRSHLRAFYTWAVDEGYAQADPTEKVPPIRVTRGLPRPMTDRDFRRALDTATPRMRAWLLLMALAGLRCMEVSALRPEDIQMGNVARCCSCESARAAGRPSSRATRRSAEPCRACGSAATGAGGRQTLTAQPNREHAPTPERDHLDGPQPSAPRRHVLVRAERAGSAADQRVDAARDRADHAGLRAAGPAQDAGRGGGGRAAATFGVMTYEVQTVRKGRRSRREDLLNEGATKGWRLVSAQVDEHRGMAVL